MHGCVCVCVGIVRSFRVGRVLSLVLTMFEQHMQLVYPSAVRPELVWSPDEHRKAVCSFWSNLQSNEVHMTIPTYLAMAPNQPSVTCPPLTFRVFQINSKQHDPLHLSRDLSPSR